ncbi:MAG: amidohydrolase family protein [Candidatus Aminicenantes bacterium]|nr:amidohydrolase family protein [Candidatus Aminicenantes bacterium]
MAFTGCADHLDDAKFEPLWETVRRLDIPVFWSLYTSHRDRLGGYVEQVVRLDRWAKSHPDIPCVYTHGIETIVMRPPEERFDIPVEVLTCLKNPNLSLEVMLPLMAPDTEYPFPWAQDMLQRLYDELGPEKLIWGSDMPAAERSVTYRQAMDYVRLHAEFMSEEDKSLFFGVNAARHFRAGIDGKIRGSGLAVSAPMRLPEHDRREDGCYTSATKRMCRFVWHQSRRS